MVPRHTPPAQIQVAPPTHNHPPDWAHCATPPRSKSCCSAPPCRWHSSYTTLSRSEQIRTTTPLPFPLASLCQIHVFMFYFFHLILVTKTRFRPKGNFGTFLKGTHVSSTIRKSDSANNNSPLNFLYFTMDLFVLISPCWR